MKCPFCKKELNIGEDKEYKTLLDHVANPNQENYPLRSTYFCSCKDGFDCFWDIYGDFYMGRKSVWFGKPILINYDAIMLIMDSNQLLEHSQSADLEFNHNGYNVEITKNKYIVRNSENEIVLDSQKHCHSYYQLEDLLLGENR